MPTVYAKRRKRYASFFALLLAVAALLICCAALLFYKGLRESTFPAELAVILGNEVYADGSVSPRLGARLDRGLALYNDGLCKKLIVSGGVGKSGQDEASAMAAYLIAHGISAKDIVMDHNGVNTWETANFTIRYMQENNLSSVIAVSQYFHVPRTRLALHQADYKGILHAVGGAYPKYMEIRDAFSLCREVAAVIMYLYRHGNMGDIIRLISL